MMGTSGIDLAKTTRRTVPRHRQPVPPPPRFLPLCLPALVLGFWPAAFGQDASDQFARTIKPLLMRKCFECHSSKADELKGNLQLETLDDILRGGDSGPAIKKGDAKESLLLKAIRYEIEDVQMPPSGKLDDADIQLLEKWVRSLGNAD